MREIPALYDVAREVCHEFGIPWTDPRTGIAYPSPKGQPKKRKKKSPSKLAKGKRNNDE